MLLNDKMNRLIILLLSIHTISCFRYHINHIKSSRRTHNAVSSSQQDSYLGIIGYDPPDSVVQASFDIVDKIDVVDYVVIGSGVGGLSAASLLNYYNYTVLVLESHYLPGGCAHTFERDGYKFDAGPSLWNGMDTRPYNPLRQILEIIGEGQSVEYKKYDGWMMGIPEGEFKFKVGEGNFEPIIKKFGGENALKEWNELNQAIKPLQELACSINPLSLRNDFGLLLTIFPYLLGLLKGVTVASQVEGNFKDVIKGIVKDKFLCNWFEFLSFALSGMPADGTIAAAVVYTMRDLHQRRATLDYPVGGSGAIVDALVRGVEKNGKGKVLTSTHVEQILIEDGKATGVKLKRNGKVIKAKRSVISNASIWNTLELIKDEDLNPEIRKTKYNTPMTDSFMHLHIGIDATGLPADLESHYSVINSWENGINAPQNHVIISIPSTLDRSLCPAGCHVIHAYLNACEPYNVWENKTSREEYNKLKEQRAEVLWKAIERFIPDVRSRVKVNLVGSPITHARFNRRHRGTFGPAIVPGSGSKLPYPKFEGVNNLYLCGDSIFPGIGLPAVASSGANAASSSVPVQKHLKMLEDLKLVNKDD